MGLEEPSRDGRPARAHRVKVPDRKHRELWRMELSDQCHIPENIGVSCEIRVAAIRQVKDVSTRQSAVDGRAVRLFHHA